MFNLVVSIDLKKAFDTVDHQILLSKLELCGIKGQAMNLLKSDLTNRKQKCQIRNSFSSECLIKCGVPQGSRESKSLSFFRNKIATHIGA